jgi:MipA family protein
MHRQLLLAGVLCAAAPLAAHAQDTTSQAKPLWEAGVFSFAVAQTAYPGAEERISRGFALPWLIYRGNFFRVDENTVGLRAVKTPTTEVDIGFAGSFGASSSEVKVREGMPSLGTLFEFGPRLKVNLPDPAPGAKLQLKLPLRAVLDVSNSFRQRGIAFEPEISASWPLSAGTRLTTEASWIFGDRKLNDHLYGVESADATATRPAYEGRAGLVATRLSLRTATTLNRDWSLFSFARVDLLKGAANNASPLVKKSSGPSYGVGLSWTFWRSQSLEE